MTEQTTERAARPGEVCTCGRPAVLVFVGGRWGETGWCGRHDGGEQTGPCPFCGRGRGPRHERQRCPRYRVRPERCALSRDGGCDRPGTAETVDPRWPDHPILWCAEHALASAGDELKRGVAVLLRPAGGGR